MSDEIVSKTVSLKLEQFHWLKKRYGNISKGLRLLLEEAQNKKSIQINRIETGKPKSRRR